MVLGSFFKSKIPGKLVNDTDVLEYIVLTYVHISLREIQFISTLKEK